MRKFLPPPAPGTDFPIPPSPPATFAAEDATLLSAIGLNVNVARPQTEGRIPSPVSRAYMFYVNLFSGALEIEGDTAEDDDEARRRLERPGRRQLMAQARRTLRGLCAAFALREVLGLEIRLRSVTIDPMNDALSEVLVPTLRFAPGGERFWRPMRFFTVQAPGGPEEVLAGLSPLTGLFPAGKPPEALTGLYWYDAGRGEWYDPTSEKLSEDGLFHVSPATSERLRQYLRAWLMRVTRELQPGDLAPSGMSRRDESLLRVELEAWLRELADVRPAEIQVERAEIPTPRGLHVLPFLEWACIGDGEHVLSDLPMHRGHLVITADQLKRRDIRIYGRVMGEHTRSAHIGQLETRGENLGEALGLGARAAPVPYVLIDRLFTPHLTVLTPGELSPEWKGLRIKNGDAYEYGLLPFDPEILEIMDPEELAENVSGELSGDSQYYIVRLQFGDEEVRCLYATSGEGDFTVDGKIDFNSFDLRFFPNFDLGAVRHLLRRDENIPSPDEHYYARVRLSPFWNFKISAFRVEGGHVFETGTSVVRGTTNDLGPDIYSPGEALFFTLPERPTGFFVQDRGFCLLELRDPLLQGQHPADWEIGIDFGTSNTCVAYRPIASEDRPRPLDLPVLTTTLFRDPQYTYAFGHVNEGNSAVYDFFYKFSQQDAQLNEQEYFPTQILTQQNQLIGGDEFDLANGLIYFRNLTLTGLSILELTRKFGTYRDVPVKIHQRFDLKQDIKWSQAEWLRAFMQHLRKHIVLSAALRNARVARTRFSYPRAFSLREKTRFESDLRKVWKPRGTDEFKTASESEAVRNYLVEDANQHVVFDVGGGTTDIIGFNANQPIFQTSFKLAAGEVNRYVVKSKAFCDAFADSFEKEMSGHAVSVDIFRKAVKAGSDEQVLNAWIGFLQSIEAEDPTGQRLIEVMSYLRGMAYEGEGDAAKAVRGFFLSVTLLFLGMAYYAGRLMRAAAAGLFDGGQGFPLTGVKLILTGNGSKLYTMLTLDEAKFDRVFQEMFEFGLRDGGEARHRVRFDGIYKLNGKPAPKVTVALGLLTRSDAGDVNEEEIPVANIAGEAGYESEGPTAFDSSLVDFYRHLRRNEGRFLPPREAPEELSAFADRLGELLPGGRNGRFEVIPRAGKDWHRSLREAAYPEAIEHIRDRLVQNARAVDADMAEHQAEYLPALEPLFIAQVIGLLDQIRDTHAG